MTPLQVLQKLERAYSRKWWQVWIEPYISIKIDVFVTCMFALDSKEWRAWCATDQLLRDVHHPSQTPIETIRSAITKLKQQNGN